jgi:uncharacterized membrane protein
MAFCSACGGQIPEGAAVCPTCKAATAASAPAVGVVPPVAGTGLADNVAGMLAYVTIIPAIMFLVMEPYNKNRFIRFHSFQCIFFSIALFAIWIALFILAVIPFLGLITLPLHLLLAIGSLVIWIILLMKANQGLKYKLPIIGDLAEKQANA